MKRDAKDAIPSSRSLSAGRARETALREILKVISTSRHDETPVFEVILENASRLCHAPLAALTQITEDRRHYRIVAHHGARTDFIAFLAENPPELDPARYVAARAMIRMRSLHVEDLAAPDLYGATDPIRVQSVRREGIRTALFVPLVLSGQAIGCIGLWRRVVAPFSADEIALVETFADQAVIAIENVRQFRALQARTEEVQALNSGLEARVAEQVAEIERMGRLRRFLPPAVADAVIAVGEESLLNSHRAFVAVLFADMRGFTAFCEAAAPEETIAVLQAYHQAMEELLRRHGAGVDQRTGDGIMAIFNDPLPCADPARSAVALALAMRDCMADLCAGWRRRGHRLGFGVGISLGHATVGMVGSDSRHDYTASGTTVNLAARLCGEARDGEILLSPRVAEKVQGLFDIVPRGKANLKGIQDPLEIHDVQGLLR